MTSSLLKNKIKFNQFLNILKVS